MNAIEQLEREAAEIAHDRQVIGNALFAARIALNKNHDDMRRETGVHITDYYRLENGKSCLVSIHMLKRICRVLDLKLSDVVKEMEV